MLQNLLWRFLPIHACAEAILAIVIDVNFWSRCESAVKSYCDTVQSKFVIWKFGNFQAQNLLWSDN